MLRWVRRESIFMRYALAASPYRFSRFLVLSASLLTPARFEVRGNATIEESPMSKYLFSIAMIAICVAGVQAAQKQIDSLPNTRVVIYDGVATAVTAAHGKVSAASGPVNDLWITTSDLARATRFVIKPQGICRDELCFPLPKARKAEFISKRGSVTWFNLSEFARLIKQPFASDQSTGVWYFSARTAERNGYLASLEAPNFTLPDLNGKMHSLADFRGKKVLLVTWASW